MTKLTPRVLLTSFVLVVATGLVVACDDAPPPVPEAPPKAGGPAAAPVRPPAAVAPKKALPPLELTEKDFKESPNNRDPFRSFLTEFRPLIRRASRDDRKIILRRYALDELQLIAVVTGRAVRPRAMFRDPNGLGVTVKRGQRISKNAARIKRILRDKIVVEIEEKAEDKTSKVDRIIELHPKQEEDREEEEGEALETEKKSEE